MPTMIIRTVLLLLICGCVATARAALPQGVQQILSSRNVPADSLAVLVQAIDAEQPLVAHNINKPLNPASVMKVVTTYAALHLLGPDYQWQTRFYLDGRLRGQTLAGNLYVKGYGDPYLVEETLLPMVRTVRNRGLRHISGKLVIDNSHFAPVRQGAGEFDRKPFRVYNARPSALMTNFQATRFSIMADRSAARVSISIWPPSTDVVIDNEMQYARGRCRDSYRSPRMWFTRERDKVIARFRGRYSAACGQQVIHRAVSESPALFYGAFKPVWGFLGGTLAGHYAEGRVPAGARLYHTGYSRPLGELVRLINKFSNNVMTRQLLLTMAAESGSVPATVDAGRRVVHDWLRSQSIDTRGLYVDNGSGLSRDTRITAKALGQIMQHQWNSPWMPEIISSYAILGRDGTGKKRLKDSPLKGHMHLKTGLLHHVRSMAGFYRGNNGKRYIVIALHNHRNIHQATGTQVQDALIRWLDTL